MSDSRGSEAAAIIAALADPSRRALYDLLEQHGQPLGRDELSELTGLPRATAAFHLDRLVEVGALTTVFARRSGRTGPGAGRPAKLYSRAADEVTVSVPPRRYDLVGEILATAAEDSERTGGSVRACALVAAESSGHELGDATVPLSDTLAEIGYEPMLDDDGGYRLVNCPFHRLARRHTDLVCAINAAFVRGLADETTERRSVRLEPAAGQCCVRIGAPATSA